MICKVGEHSPEIVYSKDRILHPLRRHGQKGNYDFKTITWDEAFEEIAYRLQKIKQESGPEAAAIYTGSGSFERSLCDIYQPAGVAVSSASSVLFPFGSPNTMGVGALCYVAFAMIAPHVTMGTMYIDMFSDIENADLIIIWGKNPAAHCPPDDFIRIRAAVARGAKIVVIDPRRTALARLQDAEWVPIRPGTDAALALGLCNVIIEEELYDETFVKSWTAGFAEFEQYVQYFTPEYVQSITGVPPDTTLSLARRLTATDGVAPVMYSGLEYNGNGVQTVRAVLILWALAGQLDVPGGQCFKMRRNKFPLNRDGHVANPDERMAAGHNRFPLYTKYRGEFHAISLPKAVLEKDPYHIRTLISMGASITTSWPQSHIWKNTLGALDFFVCIDRQWTADMAYADIILPAVTYYETQSYMVYDNVFRIRERLIPAVGEARSDFFILAELARRLGYGNLYPQTEEELLAHVLSGSGFTPEDVRNAGGTVSIEPVIMQYRKWEKGSLRSDGKSGFDTPSGKFEIASSILGEYGYDELPRYVEPIESVISKPSDARRFPLVFNSGARCNVDLHALHHSIEPLNDVRPLPTVMINTEDAKARKIIDGQKIAVVTARGSIEMFAIVTEDIVKGSIEASGMGGGALGPAEWRNACVNDLTDLENYDLISGFPAYKALLCEIEKIDRTEIRSLPAAGEYQTLKTIEPVRPARAIYLDNNATTAIYPTVKDRMFEFAGDFGNPSSIHRLGRQVHTAIEESRKALSLLLNCTPRRITFNGGGSEGNNFIIKGVALVQDSSCRHIVTSAIEHPSVINTCRWLERYGFVITYLTPDSQGLVDPAHLSAALSDRTCLVSIMAANNETGSLQPISEFARIAHKKGVLFHSDAVQAVGKIPVDVEAWGIDFLTISGHKFHGPKGTGAVYIRKGIELEPLVHGGKQEWGLRGGTENVLGIVGTGKAAEIAGRDINDMDTRIGPLRDELQNGIASLIPNTKVNGHPTKRLPNTLSVTLPGIRGESLVLALDTKSVFFSSASACKSGSPEPSHVLLAMGMSEEEAHCTVRFSLGTGNTQEDIAETLRLLKEVLDTSVSTIRFASCR